ncbi:nuclear transport factor 2 family protein [Arthrobacter crusticola]|uniref:Nuclear transport factor 2 family protein n=1 Tax=Arthrobacter crusticola TaxID=2547960 RepID=A0A4R5U3D9_9MICC|nr:nuclear transport factor 2 family protein [Arthrobacter crusticola]TDK28210.1 nuclear transport factor 2 family protein [Arthrobacter crusticola]
MTDSSAGSAQEPSGDRLVQLAKEYFQKVDAGDTSLLGMFTDDVQAYYPQFGTVKGTEGLVHLVQALTTAVSRFHHDEQFMKVTQSGNRVVIEGIETGTLADGTPFPADSRSEGRMCNVFEFRGTLISRLHIYADPDLAGQHPHLFPPSGPS